MQKIQKNYDFIIIGSGLAGLNAALNAAPKGKVLIITKQTLKDCNSYYAQGGIAAVLGKTDNYQKHIQDTLKAGAYHNNLKAVNFIIKNGPTAIKKLIQLGVNFSKNKNNKISLGLEGGHSENRIIHNQDHTGKTIIQTLINLVKKNKQIEILENCFVKDLLVKNKICYGVQIIKNESSHNIFAQKIVIASGGMGQIYAKTTNPNIATGDGLALGIKAGCKLKDLEFVQFHPTAFDSNTNPLFLISEAVRGEGAILLNKKNERFMEKYHQDLELAPRDIVSKAIYEQSKNGPVYLTFPKKSPKIKARFPQIYAYLKKHDYDLSKDKIPVTPAAHFMCGGIETNLKAETSIQNLYAIGEVAYTGLHGANRLASNSLLECLVMSEQIGKINYKTRSVRRLGESGIARQKQNFDRNLFKISEDQNFVFNEAIPLSTSLLRKNLQQLMWKHVSIIRSGKSLKIAKQKIEKLLKTVKNSNNIKDLENHNMLTVTLLITTAAIKRKKSLGTHQINNS